MKQIWPNFDFLNWLEEYYLTYLFFSYKELDKDLMESEIDNLNQMRDNFYQQIHLETDDIWCSACQYLEILRGFNKFCAILSQKEWRTEEIVGHFLERRYPSFDNIGRIAHTLTNTKVEEYRGVDKNGNFVEFKKYMIKNIEKLLTKLEIRL